MLTHEERARIDEQLKAQGLPPKVEDPVINAKIAAILAPIPVMKTEPKDKPGSVPRRRSRQRLAS